MKFSSRLLRRAIPGALLLSLALPAQADPTVIVMKNGRSIPVSAVALRGDALVVTGNASGFNNGQTIPLNLTDHVYGDKPADINRGVAKVLTGQAREAISLLEPVLKEERATANIPGNFWLEAARAALVAYSLDREPAKAAALGKEISDATPAQGNDPFIALGKALAMPPSTSLDERETALRDLTVATLHSDICAYASYFRAVLLRDAKRSEDALAGFLAVPCLYPAGGIVLNAAAEFAAADLLAARTPADESVSALFREEAVALLRAAVRDGVGTHLAEDANKRLESMK